MNALHFPCNDKSEREKEREKNDYVHSLKTCKTDSQIGILSYFWVYSLK